MPSQPTPQECPTFHRPFSMRAVSDNGDIYYLPATGGSHFWSQEETELLISELKKSLWISGEARNEIERQDYLNEKKEFLERDPDHFPLMYGEDDPLWIVYVRETNYYQRQREKRRLEKQQQARPSGFVYVIQCAENYKIGRSKYPGQRLETFAKQCPAPLSRVLLLQADDMVALEKELHEKFAAKRTHGEWFALTKQDIASIRRAYASHLVEKQEVA